MWKFEGKQNKNTGSNLKEKEKRKLSCWDTFPCGCHAALLSNTTWFLMSLIYFLMWIRPCDCQGNGPITELLIWAAGSMNPFCEKSWFHFSYFALILLTATLSWQRKEKQTKKKNNSRARKIRSSETIATGYVCQSIWTTVGMLNTADYLFPCSMNP